MTMSSFIAHADSLLKAVNPEYFSGAKHISITAIFN